MQFHYAVFYDTDTKKWSVELDTAAYFYDGNIWSPEDTAYGWKFAEDDSEEAVLDQTLLNTLYSIVDIIPVPKEHEDAIA